MKMSDAIKALVKAQKSMGAVLKNASNPHLKSKYADLGSVLDACLSALHDNGFAIMQPCGKDEHGAFVETVLAHESGESCTSRVYLVIGKQDMQGVGSAITYARRYGLLGMAGLAPEDDDGEATKAPKHEAPTPLVRQGAKHQATPAQIADRLIQRFGEITTAADLEAFTSPDEPAGKAWDKLAKDNAAESDRVKAAYEKRIKELADAT
jgi:ERF superfamily